MATCESPDGEPLIRVGALAGPHGLAGDIKIRTTDDAPDWPGVAQDAFIAPAGTSSPAVATLKAVRIERIQMTGPGMARARLQGFASRTALEQALGPMLSKGTLYLRQRDVPAPPPDAFHVDALIGLRVIEAESGRESGVVRDVLSAGGSDFLEIEPAGGGERATIPFNRDFFPEVDVAAGWVRMAHLEGFLDPPSGSPAL
ncbi:MAG: 16S rRNA processing protein RimM [Vampirovibrionales bacterium]|nr:16S rRNA processing protein RimM [Vampirovibrionales bacterium]